MKGWLYLAAYLLAVVWGLFADGMQWDSVFWPYSDAAFYVLLGLFGLSLYYRGKGA